jgi:hypothetical protein
VHGCLLYQPVVGVSTRVEVRGEKWKLRRRRWYRGVLWEGDWG